MKKFIASIFITVFLLAHSVSAQSPVSFIMNVSPASFLVSLNMDGFQVATSSGSTFMSLRYDEISGGASFTPFINFGISINTKILFIDLSAGSGFLYNNAFYGNTYNGDIALRFRPANVFTIGIHGGPMFGNFTWDPDGGYTDDDDVKLGNLIGYTFGPTLSVGKGASFVFSVDYMMGSLDVKTYNNWSANRRDLDLSGVMVNFGFLLRVPYPNKL